MGKMWVALRFWLVAITVSTYLSGCGGSDSSPLTAAASTAKTASWTNVSVRALDGRVNINWDKAAGSSFGTALSKYNVYRSTNPANILREGNRIASNYPGTSFDYTGVDNGIYYYYAVTEINAAGEGPASRVVFTAPQAVLPAAPYGLKVTARDSAAELELIGPRPPATVSISYNLYRSTAKDFTVNLIKTPLSTFSATYVDSPLDNGTTYYYALKAEIAGRESTFSPIAAARPQATILPVNYSFDLKQLAAFGSPTNMSAEPGNGSCVIVWKDAVSPVTFDKSPDVGTTPGYILYWSYSPDVLGDNNKVAIDNITKDATSGGYKLSGLNNGTTYYFRMVAAVKGTDGKIITGRYTPGPVVSATPGLKIPAIPSGVSATQQGAEQVALSWSKDNSGLSGVTYNIYYSTTYVGTPAELMALAIAMNNKKNNVDSTKTNYTLSGQPGTTYYFVITAAVGDGESAPSNIVSVTL